MTLINQITDQLLTDDVQLVGAKGMGGCGKTELARKVATEPAIIAHFTGGVCEVNFNGFSIETPLSANESLDRVVRQFLGPQLAVQPLEPQHSESIYRQHLVNEPTLLICDNVNNKQQLEKLLPAPRNWRVLITGRNSIQIPEMKPAIEVDKAPREESVDLLRKILSNENWESQLDALAYACGDYMLALSSAGAAARIYHGSPADFVQDLLEQRRLIREGGNQYGDVMEEVAASLQLSLAQLADKDALPGLPLLDAWQKLAVFSGHFDALAAHVIWSEQPIEEWNDEETISSRNRIGTKALSLLAKQSLLQTLETNDNDGVHFRFQFHDIYRDIAFGHVDDDTRTGLQLGHGSHYKNLLSRCDNLYSDHHTAMEGLRLFEREWHQFESAWDRLMAIDCPNQDLAFARDRLLAQFPADGVYVFCIRQGTEQRELWLQEAVRRAEAIDDKELFVVNTSNLGIVLKTRGDLDGAEEMLRKSLKINQELGRKEGMAILYGNLGIVLRMRGDLDGAEKMYREALKIDQALGRKEGMANLYGNRGNVLMMRRDLDGAEKMYRMSLKINQELGRKEGMALDYCNLGVVLQTRGDIDGARELWNESLNLFREIGAKDKIELVERWLTSLDD